MKMLFTCQLCNFERRDCLYCMINNVCFHCLSCFKREEGWNLCADFFSKKVAFYHFTICGHLVKVKMVKIDFGNAVIAHYI